MAEQNPSSCNSNCGSCSSGCPSKSAGIQKLPLAPGSSVKKVIGIVSGKGGVGKSTVCSLLASAMNKAGYHVGILDADITGPSIPKAFGLAHDGVALSSDGKSMVPEKSAGGVEIISTNLLLENETDPVIWRGSMIANAVKQFWQEVEWKDIDYLFVDMPPGTGDVPLTVFQSMPVAGIVIVTSPQDLVSMIVQKAVRMAEKMNIPILGIVENMSYLQCPHCEEKISVFGESHIEELAEKEGLELLAKLPIEPGNAAYMDAGAVEAIDTSKTLAHAVEVLKGILAE